MFCGKKRSLQKSIFLRYLGFFCLYIYMINLQTSRASHVSNGILLDFCSPKTSFWLLVKASSQKTDRELRVGGLYHPYLFK